jgi:hypothetical protein
MRSSARPLMTNLLEPLLMHFKPLRRAGGRAPECSSKGFCISGRCFVMMRRGKQTRYSEPEGAPYSETQANTLQCIGLYGSSGAHSPPGPRVESRIGAAGVAPGHHHKMPSAVRAQRHQQMGLHGLHPKNTADRVRLPVLTPHAPSRKPKAIYRVRASGTNPPDSSGASGSSSNTPGRPTVVFLSASRPQVGGLTSDSSLAGQGTLVKARGTVSPTYAVVGRFPRGRGAMSEMKGQR